MNKIEAAVAPLKNDAMDSAEKAALARVETVRAELDAAGWDLNVAAPYPRSMFESKASYRAKQAKYVLFINLTKCVDTNRMNSTHICAMDDENIARFVKMVREQAAANYEAFVAKLTRKIGTVVSAELAGNHVWSSSVLTVTKEDGSTERWSTKQILNWSVHGKIFNQWPTRKIK